MNASCVGCGAGEELREEARHPPDFFDFIIVDECHRDGAIADAVADLGRPE